MLCKQDKLQSNSKAMVFGKANNKGFLKEFKPISPIAWKKMRKQRLNISNFIKQLNPTLYAKQDMGDFAPYQIFPGEIPV